MRFRRGLNTLARQPEPLPQRLRISRAFVMGRPIRPAARCGVTLQRPAQPKHCLPLPVHPPASPLIGDVQLQRITDTGPSYLKFGAFDLPRRRGSTASPLVTVMVSVHVAAMPMMKPPSTDNNPPPHRYRNLSQVTGLATDRSTLCAPWPNSAGAAHTGPALGRAAACAGAFGACPSESEHPGAALTREPSTPRRSGARPIHNRYQQGLPSQSSTTTTTGRTAESGPESNT